MLDDKAILFDQNRHMKSFIPVPKKCCGELEHILMIYGVSTVKGMDHSLTAYPIILFVPLSLCGEQKHVYQSN